MRIHELLKEDEAGEVHGTGQLIPFPQGTTMVDVSDVYDWYKLGMVISDLDDADPETFGQGAPHTVIAFGRDECLREVELSMNAFNIKYKRIDSLVY